MEIISFLTLIFLIEKVSSEHKNSTIDLPPQWKTLHDQMPTDLQREFLKAYSSMQFEISSVKGLASTFSQTIDILNRKIIIINETSTCSRSIRFITNYCEKHYINKLSPTVADLEFHYPGYHTQFRNDPANTLHRIYKIHGFQFNKDTYQVEYNVTTSNAENNASSFLTPKKYKILPQLRDIRRRHRWVWFTNTISSCLILRDKFLMFWKKLIILFKKHNCDVMCLSKVIIGVMHEANKLHYYHTDSDFIDYLPAPEDIKEASLKYAKCISNFHRGHNFVHSFSTIPIRDHLNMNDEYKTNAENFQQANFHSNLSAELGDVFTDL